MFRTNDEEDTPEKLSAKGGVRKPSFRRNGWDEDELKLLGKLPDEEVARITGRSVNGVRIRRTRMGLASVADRRRCENRTEKKLGE